MIVVLIVCQATGAWNIYRGGIYLRNILVLVLTFPRKILTFSLLTFCLDLQSTRNLKYFFVSDLANDWMLCINRMSSHAFLI